MNKIRQQAKSYAFDNDGFGYDLNTCEDIFTDGAEWAIDNVCAWLSEHFYDGIYQFHDDEGTWIDADEMIEDLRQYYKKGGKE